MGIPKVEKDFIGWCNYIHPDINPYIFFQRHARYSDEYFPLLEKQMCNLHIELSKKLPNINFSFKGRIKSKRSFLIKSFRTMSDSIEKLFPSQYPTDKEQLKAFEEERSKNIEKYFKFYLKETPPKIERFLKIKSIIENTSPDIGTLYGFRSLFEQLSPDEKEDLVIRLGRTEDTFANRIIVNDVDFNIQSVRSNSDGQLEILDEHGNAIPILSSVLIPSAQIEQDDKGMYYAIVDGEKKEISAHNLLYPIELSAKERTFENASKTSSGEITLLQDSLIINDDEQLDILSTSIDGSTGDILITTHPSKQSKYFENNNNIINLSKLLRNKNNIKLKKVDNKYTEQALYDIQNAMYEYYDEIGITRIWKRSKDYVKSPKKISNYKSLHDSFFYEEFGYSLETQIRDLEMEKNCVNKIDTTLFDTSFMTAHDNYKKEKVRKWSQNPILHDILEKDPDAFDSSTEILEKLLYNSNVGLPDLLGKYILVAKFHGNVVDSFTPKIHTIFEHTFQNPKAYTPDSQDTLPPLDFSTFEKFIHSRKVRNDSKSRGNYNIDYDDL